MRSMILIILMLLVLLTGCVQTPTDSDQIEGTEASEVSETTLQVGGAEIYVDNEQLDKGHVYVFDVINEFATPKDCKVTIRMTSGDVIHMNEEQDIGIIPAGGKITVSEPLDIPEGNVTIEAFPECGD